MDDNHWIFSTPEPDIPVGSVDDILSEFRDLPAEKAAPQTAARFQLVERPERIEEQDVFESPELSERSTPAVRFEEPPRRERIAPNEAAFSVVDGELPPLSSRREERISASGVEDFDRPEGPQPPPAERESAYAGIEDYGAHGEAPSFAERREMMSAAAEEPALDPDRELDDWLREFSRQMEAEQAAAAISTGALVSEPEETASEEEPGEEPAPARRRAAENPRPRRSLFASLFGERKAPRDEQPPEEEAYEEAEEPEVQTVSAPRAAELPGSRDFAPHAGSIGAMEREARETIEQMQAQSGARRRRERSAADYTYDLDELLSIPAESEESTPVPEPEPEQALAPAAEQGCDPAGDPEDGEEDALSGASEPVDLDTVLGYEADPTASDGRPETPYRPRSAEEELIDSRFHLGGEGRRAGISYAGSQVDLSADEDYVPAQSTHYNPSQWTPEYDDPLGGPREAEEPERKKHRFVFGSRIVENFRADRSKRVKEQEEPAEEKPQGVRITTFDDNEVSPARYAEETEESLTPDFSEDDELRAPRDRRYRDSALYVPPTFREYVLSILGGVWLRIRGTVRGVTAETMDDTEEELGAELSPMEASRYYGSFLRSMRLRVRIAGGILALLCYISLEAPVPGMLKTLPVAAAFCLAAQAAILLLALDVVTNGALNLVRLRPGADSLAVIACVFTGLDALNVALSKSASLHMPLCAISSASVVGLLLAAYLSARGLRKATRVPAIGKRFYAVTAETKAAGGDITLLKSLRSAKGFVRRAEQASPDETLYTRLSFPLLALALLLTLVIMIAKRSYAEFLYIFSALLVLTVPFGAMLSFALPFYLGSTRLFRFGAAVAGWSGLCDIGASRSLIVTDRDLFPPSSVTIESVRVFADEDAQKVISFAGSMMAASGCCSADCFRDLMEETSSPLLNVDGFEVMPGGGFKGVINRQVVLCGSTELMRLMNVRVPFRLTDRTTVLLAIDGVLYGIFSLKYEGLPQVRRALVAQIRSSHPPVFAVRDFCVTPDLLHTVFDLSTDGYDFPPYVERYHQSQPAEDIRDERITAVLCNEGLGPLTSVADIGRTAFVAVRVNVVVNLIAALLGMLTVFVRLVGAGSWALSSFFLYMLVWTLPVLAVSLAVSLKR